MQARALGTSLAMAVARGEAPVEIKCNGTINSERLTNGYLDNAGDALCTIHLMLVVTRLGHSRLGTCVHNMDHYTCNNVSIHCSSVARALASSAPHYF